MLFLGRTPLRVACTGGHVTCAEALISRNADVSYPDMDNRQIIYILALENRPECIPVIIHGGAGKAHNIPLLSPIIVSTHMGHCHNSTSRHAGLGS